LLHVPVLAGKNSGANVTGPEFFLHESVLPGFFFKRQSNPMRIRGRVE
jgi:hypothetical protein